MDKVLCCSLNSEKGPHLDILKRAGFEVVHRPADANVFNEDVLAELLADCCASVAGSEPYTARVLSRAPKLRVISRSGVGFDAVDVEACDRASVAVATTPGVNHHAVAEHTIALLLGVARGFPDRDRRVRDRRWARLPRPRVMGTTLGIVGLGRIGRAVATRAVGLGMRVIAYEPFPNLEFAEQWGVEIVDLEALLSRSDYVSLHAPMTRENRHLINERTISTMKNGAVLINTARGGLVDEQSLVAALESGHLGGAGLDVFETEPLPLDSPLLSFNNVLLSGHIAGLDIESQHDTFAMVADTIVRLSRGEWPAERIQNLKGVNGWSWRR